LDKFKILTRGPTCQYAGFKKRKRFARGERERGRRRSSGDGSSRASPSILAVSRKEPKGKMLPERRGTSCSDWRLPGWTLCSTVSSPAAVTHGRERISSYGSPMIKPLLPTGCWWMGEASRVAGFGYQALNQTNRAREAAAVAILDLSI
jgi:hypothetical protein